MLAAVFWSKLDLGLWNINCALINFLINYQSWALHGEQGIAHGLILCSCWSCQSCHWSGSSWNMLKHRQQSVNSAYSFKDMIKCVIWCCFELILTWLQWQKIAPGSLWQLNFCQNARDNFSPELRYLALTLFILAPQSHTCSSAN